MTLRTVVEKAVHIPPGKKAFWRNHIYWRAKRPDSPMRVELANLLRNIVRDESDLDAMTIEPGDCCHGCVYGDAWWQVHDRLKRRLERANQITRKLWYDAGNYGPVPMVYSSRL